MKKVQRIGGKMLKRSDDQQDVQAVILEFRSVENTLERLLRDLKLWRDSWDDILRLQYDTSEAFSFLYKPLEPPPDPDAKYSPRETPPEFLRKCLALQKLYSDEKDDLAQEIGLINAKVIRPVDEARMALRGLQKTLKHRENMKLDYERYLSRAEHARKKDVKSIKDETTLAKHEGDLVQSKIDYQTADEQVISTFPPVSQAVAGLMPFVLAAQVMLQTTLVGQLYTCLDGYCRANGMPSPAPGNAEIVGVWEREFTGLRKEVESGLSLVSQGRAVNMSMSLPEENKGPSMTGLGIRNKAKSGAGAGMGYIQSKKNGQGTISNKPSFNNGSGQDGNGEEEDAPPKPPRPGGSNGPSPLASPYPPVNLANKPRMPSSSSVNAYAAAYDQKVTTSYDQKPLMRISSSQQHLQQQAPPPYEETSTYGGGGTSPAASSYHTPRTNLSPAPSTTAGRSDYFDRKPSYSTPSTTAASPAGVLATAAAKKKPPPPIPAKRIPSQQQGQIVVALYDFEGQNDGDLSFREGDRITVLRKTESVDDWWEGLLARTGGKGSFPANYVQL